jgi:hypothetical protein
VSSFLYLGALLGLKVRFFQSCRFSKDRAPNGCRRPGGRKPAGLRRRTFTGGTHGARSHPSVAAASGEEHHVRYIDESTRRPCFDIWERVLVIRCADPLGRACCSRSTTWVWWGLIADGGALDTVEPTRGSPGAVLDREVLCWSRRN